MDAQEAAADFAARRDRESRRAFARRPKKIGDVLAQLITQRGYGRIAADEALRDAWREAAGEELAGASRPGRLRRGQLEVFVAHSTLMQEFGFAKQQILSKLRARLPDANIRDLRFRVGQIQE